MLEASDFKLIFSLKRNLVKGGAEFSKQGVNVQEAIRFQTYYRTMLRT